MPSLNDLKDMSFQIYGLWNKRDIQRHFANAQKCPLISFYYNHVHDSPCSTKPEEWPRLLNTIRSNKCLVFLGSRCFYIKVLDLERNKVSVLNHSNCVSPRRQENFYSYILKPKCNIIGNNLNWYPQATDTDVLIMTLDVFTYEGVNYHFNLYMLTHIFGLIKGLQTEGGRPDPVRDSPWFVMKRV